MSLPLTLPSVPLTNTLSVQVVINPNYYTAIVTFTSGGMQVYQTALTQTSPNADLTKGITIGSVLVNSGGLHMALPGSLNPGNVTLTLDGVDTSNGNQPVKASSMPVATWNLNQ